MLRVALVNMPFSNSRLPSIALAQLRAVLAAELADRVECRVLHLNHDFGQDFGLDRYDLIANSLETTTCGLGDWFFRQAAFPDEQDNTERYARRYARNFGDKAVAITELIRDKRGGVAAFLDRLIDRYELDRCDVVGFTSMFTQNVACFAMARRLKERNGDIVTVMGGANCETPMGQVIARNVEAVDFVFSGPALETFPQFVGHLLDGEPEKCHQITGVFSRERLRRHPLDKLNEVGGEIGIEVEIPLDYDDFLASIDEKLPPGTEPILLFETSRGCWWGERAHCTFCGLNGLTMKYRGMSPERALAQFESLFSRYYPRVKTYESVDNIMPREYLTKVFPQLQPPEGVTLFYEVKADLKAHEMAVLSAAGVTQIQPGIEALATSTLKLMRKGTTAFHNLRFLKNCLAYGIHPAWNLLIGFPGEEEEVYKKYVEDLGQLVHLPPPTGTFPVRFDRFSPYFTLADEYGLELKPYDFYSLVYPFSEQDLGQLAYFFVDQNFRARYLELTARWIGKLRERIDYWHNRWHERDDGLKPALTFKWRGSQKVVYDSRSGEALEHELGEDVAQLLDLLSRPSKAEGLATKLGWAKAETEDRLGELRELGVVFQEGDRYLSLLVEQPQADDFPLADLIDSADFEGAPAAV